MFKSAICNFKSPNYSKRSEKVQYIIIHYTEMPFELALDRLTDVEAEVSAHYVIKEDGDIFCLVDEKHVAWHAGISYWKGEQGLNKSSIGIELDNSGREQFTEEQVTSCIKLCHYLQRKYNIESRNILGHSDIAPDRKIDPGIYFDWYRMFKSGLGIWYGADVQIAEEAAILCQFGDSGKLVSDIQYNLHILGYKIEQTGEFDEQMNYVVRAFYAKFCPLVLQKLGIDRYNLMNSKYFWDQNADNILKDLQRGSGVK